MNHAVTVSEPQDGTLLFTMHDRESKNTFSEALVGGLIDAFARAAASPACRCVVMTGYDSYFACGGTQQGLLAIQRGELVFTDVNMYSLALDCPVPVIAAMQGHGIGGGFVMGMYCDFVILSRESVYTTNFMKYGFTPGMGATAVVPHKLGFALAHEMLLGAQTYRGADLERRGVPFAVLPRHEVLPHALSLAAQVAQKPRGALVTLKSHMVRGLREQLPSIVADEVAMHDATFHNDDVKARIESRFGQ
ncbi:polyketide synthase [Burkholderia thailandensis]|uniref:polyketide synthase n=1 Tax=Burkholderia thailandensis TaxID=57975 RepID=UPI00217DF044|nr:polyketide synthase [Burkholderia thailandensis]MCS6514301.1 polyketide synthase [Burkholderia thailandensis]